MFYWWLYVEYIFIKIKKGSLRFKFLNGIDLRGFWLFLHKNVSKFIAHFAFLGGQSFFGPDLHDDGIMNIFKQDFLFQISKLSLMEYFIFLVHLIFELVLMFQLIGLIKIWQSSEHLKEELNIAEDVQIGEIFEFGF